MITLFVKNFGAKDVCMNLAEGSELANEFSIEMKKAQNKTNAEVAAEVIAVVKAVSHQIVCADQK